MSVTYNPYPARSFRIVLYFNRVEWTYFSILILNLTSHNWFKLINWSKMISFDVFGRYSAIRTIAFNRLKPNSFKFHRHLPATNIGDETFFFFPSSYSTAVIRRISSKSNSFFFFFFALLRFLSYRYEFVQITYWS